MTPSVEVVVINYKRPQNIPAIIRAFQTQSVSCKISIVDCHPSSEFSLSDDVLNQANEVFRVSVNRGAFNRYTPSHFYKSDFTYFHDDDMLPGNRAIEHFLQSWGKTYRCGVLGQFGRRLPNRHKRYKSKAIQQVSRPLEVDMLIRGYFIQTKTIPYVFQMASHFPDYLIREDDFMLCFGLKVFGGLTNYMTPLADDPEKSICIQELDNKHALSCSPKFIDMRTECLDRMYNLGWKNKASIVPFI